VPDIISKLTKAGLEVVIESGAGVNAQAADQEFKTAGADVKSGDVLTGADVVLSVQPLTPAQMKTLKKSFSMTTYLFRGGAT
jgi:NAD(P) transhydrogenase subunit alpha